MRGRALAACLAHNQEVGGSIPPPATRFNTVGAEVALMEWPAIQIHGYPNAAPLPGRWVRFPPVLSSLEGASKDRLVPSPRCKRGP